MSQPTGSIPFSTYVAQQNANMANSAIGNQQANSTFQNALGVAGANRTGQGGDVISVEDLLGLGQMDYRNQMSANTGALPTSVNYPSLNEKIHQGTYGGKMIGNVPIYASPGVIVPIGIEQARSKALLEAGVKAQQKGKKEKFAWEDVMMPEGYNKDWQDAIYGGVQERIYKAQMKYGPQWERALNSLGTEEGRELAQWHKTMQGYSANAKSIVDKAQQIVKYAEDKEGAGMHVSDEALQQAKDILAATQDMRSIVSNPEKGDQIIGLGQKLVSRVGLEKYLRDYWINTIKPDTDLVWADNPYNQTSGKSAGDIYKTIMSTTIDDTEKDDMGKSRLDYIVDVLGRENRQIFRDYNMDTPEGIKEVKGIIKSYYGKKIKDEFIRNRQATGGGGKLPAATLTPLYMLNEFSNVFQDFKNTGISSSTWQDNIKVGKDNTVRTTGRYMTYGRDASGNTSYGVNQNPTFMIGAYADVDASELEKGTSANRLLTLQQTLYNPGYTIGLNKNLQTPSMRYMAFDENNDIIEDEKTDADKIKGYGWVSYNAKTGQRHEPIPVRRNGDLQDASDVDIDGFNHFELKPDNLNTGITDVKEGLYAKGGWQFYEGGENYGGKAGMDIFTSTGQYQDGLDDEGNPIMKNNPSLDDVVGKMREGVGGVNFGGNVITDIRKASDYTEDNQVFDFTVRRGNEVMHGAFVPEKVMTGQSVLGMVTVMTPASGKWIFLPGEKYHKTETSEGVKWQLKGKTYTGTDLTVDLEKTLINDVILSGFDNAQRQLLQQTLNKKHIDRIQDVTGFSSVYGKTSNFSRGAFKGSGRKVGSSSYNF
tara:strand:+ start:4924 stop:7383 length:2460 start_codon:yes stop_codon:yes gene_type:complete